MLPEFMKPGIGYRQKYQMYFGASYYQELEKGAVSYRPAKPVIYEDLEPKIINPVLEERQHYKSCH